MTNIEPEAPKKKNCVVCCNQLPADAIYCDKCKLPQVPTTHCRVCRQLIPEKALCCNACHVFQDWRRHIPTAMVLSFLTALASVVSFGYTQVMAFANRHSSTTIQFQRADGTTIYMNVANTGGSQSTLTNYRLMFGKDVPIMTTLLDPANNATSIVPSHGQLNFGLLVPGLHPSGPNPNEFTCEEIVKKLIDGTATVEIEVEESDRKLVPRSVSLLGYRLREVVRQKLECRKD